MKKYVQKFLAIMMITAFISGGISEFRYLYADDSQDEITAEEIEEEEQSEQPEDADKEAEADLEDPEPEDTDTDWESSEKEIPNPEDSETEPEEELLLIPLPILEESPAMAMNSVFFMPQVYRVGNFADLKQAIADAADGDTIIIEDHIIFTERLSIEKSLNFTGENDNPYTLTSPTRLSHFFIEADNILLQFNHIILNGNDVGGGIYIQNSNNIKIFGNNLQFVNNRTQARADRAIYMTYSQLELQGDILFKNNSTNISGGAINANHSTLIIKDGVRFVNNSAESSGGAIDLWYCEAEISGDVTFTENHADSGGGAMHINGTEMILGEGVLFNKNTSVTSGGGVTINQLCTLKINGKVNFTENATEGNAGAITVFSTSKLEINDEVSFIKNSAGKNGGAITVSSNDALEINSKTIFEENTTEQYGGAIYGIYASMAINSEADFIGNTAEQGGAIYSASLRVDISGKANFTENTAEQYGGAIFGIVAPINLTGEANFTENTAETGGAIYFDRTSSLNISGKTDFEKNRAETDGGAIYAIDSASIEITGEALFKENTAGLDGGAIHAGDLNKVSVSENVIFENNKAAVIALLLSDADILLHSEKIKTDKFTYGLPYGYNNLDIYYMDAEGKSYSIVSFDTDGGTNPPESQFVAIHDFAQAPPDPEKPGYVFEGWFTEQGQQWIFNKDTVPGDMTLYAKWKTDDGGNEDKSGGDNTNENNGGENNGGENNNSGDTGENDSRDSKDNDKDTGSKEVNITTEPETIPAFLSFVHEEPDPPIDNHILEPDDIPEAAWNQAHNKEENRDISVMTIEEISTNVIEEDGKTNPKTAGNLFKMPVLYTAVSLAVITTGIHKRKKQLINL